MAKWKPQKILVIINWTMKIVDSKWFNNNFAKTLKINNSLNFKNRKNKD